MTKLQEKETQPISEFTIQEGRDWHMIVGTTSPIRTFNSSVLERSLDNLGDKCSMKGAVLLEKVKCFEEWTSITRPPEDYGTVLGEDSIL